MNLTELAKHPASWLSGQGPETDIVISSRIRLARNVSGYPFTARASSQERSQLQEMLKEAILNAEPPQKVAYFRVDQLDSVDQMLLLERHLVSHELATGEGERGVAISEDEHLSIMVNEEDHLRIQLLRPGFQLEQTWQEIDRVDTLIGERIPYAFCEDLGYLTACPTNVGTGMRISTMLHLPAIALVEQLDKVLQALARISYTVRGWYGEGTQAHGDFYQISNQRTLGKSEEQFIKEMRDIIPEIITFERKCRQKLMHTQRRRLEDRIWRAYGTLTQARVVSSREALELLSALRLGVNLELLAGDGLSKLNELCLFVQPAHIQKQLGRTLQTEERDAVRADILRENLASLKPAR
jgi:protein arginine kinase